MEFMRKQQNNFTVMSFVRQVSVQSSTSSAIFKISFNRKRKIQYS